MVCNRPLAVLAPYALDSHPPTTPRGPPARALPSVLAPDPPVVFARNHPAGDLGAVSAQELPMPLWAKIHLVPRQITPGPVRNPGPSNSSTFRIQLAITPQPVINTAGEENHFPMD